MSFQRPKGTPARVLTWAKRSVRGHDPEDGSKKFFELVLKGVSDETIVQVWPLVAMDSGEEWGSEVMNEAQVFTDDQGSNCMFLLRYVEERHQVKDQKAAYTIRCLAIEGNGESVTSIEGMVASQQKHIERLVDLTIKSQKSTHQALLDAQKRSDAREIKSFDMMMDAIELSRSAMTVLSMQTPSEVDVMRAQRLDKVLDVVLERAKTTGILPKDDVGGGAKGEQAAAAPAAKAAYPANSLGLLAQALGLEPAAAGKLSSLVEGVGMDPNKVSMRQLVHLLKKLGMIPDGAGAVQ